MYRKIIHFILYTLYILPCFIVWVTSFAQTHHDDNLHFLSQAGILLDYSILESNAGFTGKQSKALDLLIFSYNDFNLSTYFKEDIYTSKRYNSTYYPYRIAYYMDYAWISFPLENSKIGIIFNHICYNTFDKQKRNIGDELRWYGIGIKWQSNGMQIGTKNTFVNNALNIFDLNNLNYTIDISYPFMSKIPEYKCISNFILRYDIPLLSFTIPYIEGYIKGLLYANDDLSIDRSIESGVKIQLDSINIIPYFNYSFTHDNLHPGISDSQIGFGLRAESLIGPDFLEQNHYYSPLSLNDMSMHCIAGYSKNISSSFYNFTTDFGITLQSLINNKNLVYFSSYLNHSSESETTALYPRFIDIVLETGYNHLISNQHYLTFGYEHLRRHDGNQYRGQTEYYHAIQSGIKHIFLEKNQSAKYESSHYVFTDHNFDYELTVSYVIKKQSYPYFLIINPKATYYWIHYFSWQPYTGVELTYFAGKDKNYEYIIEQGLIFNSTIPLTVYYAFKRDIDIDIIGGASDFYHVIGIRLRI